MSQAITSVPTHIQAAWSILKSAEKVVDEQQIEAAIDRLASAITERLADQFPLVVSVMGGAVVMSGQLLPKLHFPLEIETIHVTRYGKALSGGELEWRVTMQQPLEGRVVLVLDDILDEGKTLAALRNHCQGAGVKAFYSAVLANKLLDQDKPITADFCGVDVPNRYVFGCGMDVRGLWRNLPAIWALPD